MKKLWLLLLMVIPLRLIHAQEVKHAPTAEQCRADMRLWLSKLQQQPIRSGVAKVGVVELQGWASEMSDCITVDPTFALDY